MANLLQMPSLIRTVAPSIVGWQLSPCQFRKRFVLSWLLPNVESCLSLSQQMKSA